LKYTGDFYLAIENTGVIFLCCHLPLCFVAVPIGRGSLGYKNYFGDSFMGKTLGNTEIEYSILGILQLL
jgi:hypothetical protein